MAKGKYRNKRRASYAHDAELTAARRDKLPPRVFGLAPKDGQPGKYPMENREHAANAKARAEQEYKAGRLTAAQKAEIDGKANRILGEDHLIEGKSDKARSANIKTEVKAGKPPAQAAAIAYRTQREAQDGLDPQAHLMALYKIAGDCMAYDAKPRK